MDGWNPYPIIKMHNRGQCAWCASPIQGESFTVTFPDKDQAVFHIECLYQYRDAMKAQRH